jgi:trehalose 6-phosphate synthase
MPTTRPVVLVSNRGPLAFRWDDDGRLVARRGAGGLVSGLLPLVVGTDAVWIASAMSEADRAAAEQGVVEREGVRARLLALPPADFRAAYDVVGNATLWFVHHGLYDLGRRPRFETPWHAAWDAYRRVNERFADAVAESAPDGAAVLVQDYHLALMGPLVASRRPDVRCVHFSHTPFAGPDLLRVLPRAVRAELLGSMAGHHACGFHTERWRAGFEAACTDAGVVTPATFVAPLGPDPVDLATTAASERCDTALAALRARVGGRRLLVRVDRIEPSKNLVRGFVAYDHLLAEHPEHRGEVVFYASVYPSREGLPEYLAYRQEVEATVDAVNRRWGDAAWQPVVLDLDDDYPASVAALRAYDVLVVNPVRDGLNLVAKEGPVVNERAGVLLLSTEAGAYGELADAALAVDPCDITGTADAMHAALTLDGSERAQRAELLRQLAVRRSPAAWLADQLAAAEGS